MRGIPGMRRMSCRYKSFSVQITYFSLESFISMSQWTRACYVLQYQGYTWTMTRAPSGYISHIWEIGCMHNGTDSSLDTPRTSFSYTPKWLAPPSHPTPWTVNSNQTWSAEWIRSSRELGRFRFSPVRINDSSKSTYFIRSSISTLYFVGRPKSIIDLVILHRLPVLCFTPQTRVIPFCYVEYACSPKSILSVSGTPPEPLFVLCFI